MRWWYQLEQQITNIVTNKSPPNSLRKYSYGRFRRRSRFFKLQNKKVTEPSLPAEQIDWFVTRCLFHGNVCPGFPISVETTFSEKATKTELRLNGLTICVALNARNKPRNTSTTPILVMKKRQFRLTSLSVVIRTLAMRIVYHAEYA